MHSCIRSCSEERSGQNTSISLETFLLSEYIRLIQLRESQWIILLDFVECESAVRSCGDGADCVAGTKMGHSQQAQGSDSSLLLAWYPGGHFWCTQSRLRPQNREIWAK